MRCGVVWCSGMLCGGCVRALSPSTSRNKSATARKCRPRCSALPSTANLLTTNIRSIIVCRSAHKVACRAPTTPFPVPFGRAHATSRGGPGEAGRRCRRACSVGRGTRAHLYCRVLCGSFVHICARTCARDVQRFWLERQVRKKTRAAAAQRTRAGLRSARLHSFGRRKCARRPCFGTRMLQSCAGCHIHSLPAVFGAMVCCAVCRIHDVCISNYACDASCVALFVGISLMCLVTCGLGAPANRMVSRGRARRM